MTEIKGQKLFVNLGASQVRKRLKGFGHGVRKTQSNGKNQAVVIHTATGAHLDELKNVFRDVGCYENQQSGDEPVANIRNLGQVSASWLRQCGICTRAELEKMGAAHAYRIVKQSVPEASLNLLWAMAAGLLNKDWRELSDDDKKQLLRELENQQ